MARASIRQHLHATSLWLVVCLVAGVHAHDGTATDWASSVVAVVFDRPSVDLHHQVRRGSEDGRLFWLRPQTRLKR